MSQRLLADKMNISAHHLSSLLNDHMGISYADYIKGWRMSEAVELLFSYNNLSLEGISVSLGYKSKSTFYKHFKETYGLTPAQYRDQI